MNLFKTVLCLGGFELQIEHDDVQVQEHLEPLWQMLFPHRDAVITEPQGRVRLRFITSPPQRPTTVDFVARGDQSELWRIPGGYYLAYEASAMLLNAKSGEGWVYLAPDFWQQPLSQQRQTLLLTIILLLHRQGSYVLHANGVAWSDEDSILISGPSGSGKTTLTLSLVSGGGHCLGDDALLLRERGDQVWAFALRQGFACTSETAEYFPELADQLTVAPVLAEQKKLLALETIWPDRFIPHCVPRLVVFPEVANAPHSRLMPLNSIQTLCALMEQSVSLLIDTVVARDQMTLLSQLARQVYGCRLYAGRDVYAEPERVAALLRDAIQAG